MKKYIIPDTDLELSAISLGAMRYAGKSVEEIEDLFLKAIDLGINIIDHADIYRNMDGIFSENVFGEVVKKHPEIRKKLIIQSKCGICNGYYDFSKEHIIASINQSLERMNIDYLDILLLHRPDALMDPKEVGEAFEELEKDGKVRYFGVSNMNPGQIELLQKHCKQKLLFNQVQFSIVEANMLDTDFNVNMSNNPSIDHSGGLLNYCRLNDITIQAWSPLQINLFDGLFIGSEKYPELNNLLNKLSAKYNVSPQGIAFSWILRHPAHIIPIAGTTSIANLVDLAKASEITLTKTEWYDLYKSVGRMFP